MLIARWLFLLAGLAVCVCVALYLATGRRHYWTWAGRIFFGTAGAGVVFFGILAVERLIFL